jgi:predicted enzyme related to lactoylglutathione lyase
MLNFRVADLSEAVAELTQAGIAVEVDPEVYPNGVFARLDDPEGNPIQLWEPRGSEV